ncbi:VUT family protein [Nocardia sp. CA-120079]|uniref:VUT family protein n=1 Tax=Nocardia sp. CA-120079 TaxID=3239974 RepID=UPI003D9638B3
MIATAAAVGLAGSVLLANQLTTRFGFLHFGPVAVAAGTFAAGAALVLRDFVQDAAGIRAVLAVIAAGAGLSFVVAAPQLAVASMVAFTFAELADLLAYTPIRAHAEFGSQLWALAVIASGAVGAVVDTLLFLGIAFGWSAVPSALTGQLVGKTVVSMLFVLMAKGVSRVVSDPADRKPTRA